MRAILLAAALALLGTPAVADVQVMGAVFQGTLAPGETDRWRHESTLFVAHCGLPVEGATTVVLLVETARPSDRIVLWTLDPGTWRWTPHDATGFPPMVVARTVEPSMGCPWFDVEGRALGGEVAYTVYNCANRPCRLLLAGA